MTTHPDLCLVLENIVTQLDRIDEESWQDYELRPLLACVQYTASEALRGATVEVEINEIGVPPSTGRVFIVRSSRGGLTFFAAWPQEKDIPMA